ncbi:hypothetical protein [Pasteurella multocida]|uniref:hypothetical protein n=1 Tax=Pasteurella multocida TaxID=747 RepID=UPI00027B20BF|nr:hypothetical protein [Pasteurella multocida]EJS83389.1 phage tail protein/putative Fels-1 prophage host specificity protein [Pasteurella multocida subsp. multocida str. P52VAC]EPE75507.1 phage tail protein [Pasteurella multocida 1500C]KEP94119.1 phage tail protein [Pasteurella multocida subsp. multocida VTCCBAA264]KEZ11432.1 phage tail protein [Pasteurella multocida]KEZ11668.1 phage tail protein [Pasteurella multocida]
MKHVKRNQPAIPNVPASLPPDVRAFLEAVRTSLQTFQGGRNPNAAQDRAVTFADLKNGRVQLNQTNVIQALTGEGPKGSDGMPHGKAPKKLPGLFDAPVDTPKIPGDFNVSVGVTNVVLTWAQPKYRGHSYTEIFRQRTELNANGDPVDVPSFDAAQHIHAHATGSVYSDKVEPKTGYYYWIRHINAKGQAGPISSDTGLFVKVNASIRDQMIREGVSPVTTVPTTPTTYVADIVFVNDIKQMMSWDGTKYTFELPDGSVTATKIAAGVIGAEHLLAGAVTAEKLAASAITAESINVDKLSALSTNLGDITGGSLNINNRFIVRSDGTAEMRSSTQNIGLVIDNDRVAVYDDAGRLRVEIGLLSYDIGGSSGG